MYNQHDHNRSDLKDAILELIKILAIFVAALLLAAIIVGCIALATLLATSHETPYPYDSINNGVQALWHV